MNKNMTVHYANAEEKFAKSVVLMAHTDNVLYMDAGHTMAVNHDDLMNLCMKGLLVVKKDSTYYRPIFFKENSGEIEVTIATAIGTGSSTSLVVKSKTVKA